MGGYVYRCRCVRLRDMYVCIYIRIWVCGCVCAGIGRESERVRE